MKLKTVTLDVYGACAVMVIVIFSLMASLRDISVGTDTANYISIFQSAVQGGEGGRSIEPGFLMLTRVVSVFQSQGFYFFVIAFLTSILFCGVGVFKLNWRFAIYVLFVFSLPFFYGLTLNILRQGLAFGIVLRFIVFSKPSYLRGSLMVVLAGSMHYSAFFFGPMALLALRMQRSHVIVFWLVSVVLGYFDVLNNFLDSLLFFTDDYYASYLGDKIEDYKTGYRSDFLVFSMIGVLASIWIFRSKKTSSLNAVGFAKPLDVANVFFIFNGLSNLFINLPYSDRYFSWSWCLYPVLAASIFFMQTKPGHAKLSIFFIFPVVVYMITANLFL